MAQHTKGTVLKRGDGATPTENFTNVEEVNDIQGPDGSASEIDSTHLESVTKEFIMGLPDNGSITLTMNQVFGASQQANMDTDRENQTLRNWQLVFADTGSTTWAFAAFVMQFAIASATDARHTVTATLRISGAITKT